MLDIHTVAQLRGARLKSLRKTVGLSRRAFFEKFGVSVGTLQNWESPRSGGLSESGARRIISCFDTEGIYVVYEWLMYGSGQLPQVSLSKNSLSHVRLNTHRSLEKEIEFFQSYYKFSTTFILENEVLAPKFNQGDCLLGVCKKTNKAIKELIGLLCIIELVGRKKCIGYLQKISFSKRTVQLFLPNNIAQDYCAVTPEVFISIWQVIAVSRCK